MSYHSAGVERGGAEAVFFLEFAVKIGGPGAVALGVHQRDVVEERHAYGGAEILGETLEVFVVGEADEFFDRLGAEVIDAVVAVGDAAEEHQFPGAGGGVPGERAGGGGRGQVEALAGGGVQGDGGQQFAGRQVERDAARADDLAFGFIEPLGEVAGVAPGHLAAGRAAGEIHVVVEDDAQAERGGGGEDVAVAGEVVAGEVFGTGLGDGQDGDAAEVAFLARAAELLADRLGGHRAVEVPERLSFEILGRIAEVGGKIGRGGLQAEAE